MGSDSSRKQMCKATEVFYLFLVTHHELQAKSLACLSVRFPVSLSFLSALPARTDLLPFPEYDVFLQNSVLLPVS